MRSSLLVAIAVLALVWSASAATSVYTRSFNSFSDLRNAAPSAEGEYVYLISYIAGKYKGAGAFVGSLTAADDDAGVIASNGTNFHWTRVVEDFETLNVLHFGAMHDGVTDDRTAVLNMLNWSLNRVDGMGNNGIRLVEGTIFISPIDLSATTISDFAIYGPTTPYGVRPLVSIISDKSNNPAFKVSAERVVMRGLGWNGQATGTVDTNRVPLTVSNTQIFFQNVLAGGNGQNMHVLGFQSTNAGNDVFRIQDIVNSKFDQCYSVYCYGSVWNIGWSGEDGTEWDHPKSVEISNVNIQYNYGVGAIYAKRMEAGVLRNIWVEHSRNPGDISSGMWILDALNIESTLESMIMASTRDISRAISLQSGATISRGYATDGWLPDDEHGYVRIEATGIQAMAPVAALWESSLIRGYNITTNTSMWLNVGRMETHAVGGMWEFEVMSRVGTDQISSTSNVRPTNNGAPGITRIYIQRGGGSVPIVSFTNEGLTGVTAVRYVQSDSLYTFLWVQFAPYVLEYGIFVRGTGVTRFDTGGWNYFRPTNTAQLASPGGTLVSGKSSIHNGLAGIGAEASTVTIDTITVDATQVNTTQGVAGFMIMKINGVDYAVPYYEPPADYPVDPPLGVDYPAEPTPTVDAPVGASSSLIPSFSAIFFIALLLPTILLNLVVSL